MGNELILTVRQGFGLLHLGSALHGALPLQSGTRTNLIMWLRWSKLKLSLFFNFVFQELLFKEPEMSNVRSASRSRASAARPLDFKTQHFPSRNQIG